MKSKVLFLALSCLLLCGCHKEETITITDDVSVDISIAPMIFHGACVVFSSDYLSINSDTIFLHNNGCMMHCSMDTVFYNATGMSVMLDGDTICPFRKAPFSKSTTLYPIPGQYSRLDFEFDDGYQKSFVIAEDD